jgi:hypothetical protein
MFYYQATPRYRPWSGLPKDIPEKKWTGGLYKYFLHYATSEDGIHWYLPHLGLRNSYVVNKHSEVVCVEGEEEMFVKWLEDKNNNVLLSLNEKDADGGPLTGVAGAAGGFCVIDAHGTPHPAARARYTAFYQNRGFCLAYSTDGLEWTAYPENPVLVGQSSDTYNTLMYDPRREEYAIFCRPRWSRGGPDPRAVTRIASKDLIHWGPERIVLQTDDRDAPAHGRRRLRGETGKDAYTRGRELQFYGFTPSPYQDMYIGLAMVYDTFAGISWYELAHSYDGLQWKREANREPFIAGTPGAWDAGCIGYMAMGSPMEIGDHYYFYTQGSNTLHGYRLISMEDKGRMALIMAARIKKGRFIGYATGVHRPFERQRESIEIPPYWIDRGTLMTRPFRLECEKIFLNAKVADGGNIIVEVRSGLDAATASTTFDVMKAYDLEHADPIRNIDAIKIPVTFKGADLKPLCAQMIRLRIHMEKATVYGLSFE